MLGKEAKKAAEAKKLAAKKAKAKKVAAKKAKKAAAKKAEAKEAAVATLHTDCDPELRSLLRSMMPSTAMPGDFDGTGEIWKGGQLNIGSGTRFKFSSIEWRLPIMTREIVIQSSD